MPSLRRSFSSPSVRSSPYLSPSSTRTRTSAPHPRRAPPSATAERRVLADIEWWRVYDGQCDPHHDGQPLDPDVPPGGSVTLSAGGGSLSLDSMPSLYPSALSIAPHSPPGDRHGRDLSVESTPEPPTAPLESIQLALASPVACPFGDHFPFPPSPTRLGRRPVHPLFGLRSISVPGLSHQGTLAPDFVDMGGDSFSLDQNLFQ